MKYEIELKIREHPRGKLISKWKQICFTEKRLKHVKKAFEYGIQLYDVADYVILINKLDDSGNFIETIQ